MLVYVLKQILGALFLGLPLVILAWAIWRWFRASPRIGVPVWRGYVAIVAIGLAGMSALLWVVSLIWARAIGGFPYYDPVLLRFYGWGSTTSAIGLLFSFVGKGKLRWPACGLSFLMTALWFMAAMGE
jgi:hypothetical protein